MSDSIRMVEAWIIMMMNHWTLEPSKLCNIISILLCTDIYIFFPQKNLVIDSHYQISQDDCTLMYKEVSGWMGLSTSAVTWKMFMLMINAVKIAALQR